MECKGVHPEIRSHLPELLDSLKTLGYRCISSEYSPGAFGNFYLDAEGPKGRVRIVRDKGQYRIDGTDVDGIEDIGEFTTAAESWLQADSRQGIENPFDPPRSTAGTGIPAWLHLNNVLPLALLIGSGGYLLLRWLLGWR